MDKRTDEKKTRLLEALDKGLSMIHLDARRPGVLVPVHLRQESHLLLNLSYRFDPPDLSVGEWGVRCTLTFSGSRFTVAVPWSALYAISSHVTKEFWMYPDDMPAELLAGITEKNSPFPEVNELLGLDEDEDNHGVEASKPEPKSARAVLREVLATPIETDGEPDQKQPEPPQPPKRGHLRLVK